MTNGAAYETWCTDCNRHHSRCECKTLEHIWLVTYRLVVNNNAHMASCEEQVRCVANDLWMATDLVTQWALTTECIWWNENDHLVEHRVPFGPRDVTIIKIEKYAEDVGEMLKQCPLPTVFQHEE